MTPKQFFLHFGAQLAIFGGWGYTVMDPKHGAKLGAIMFVLWGFGFVGYLISKIHERSRTTDEPE